MLSPKICECVYITVRGAQTVTSIHNVARLQQCRCVFLHANSHKGARFHPAIDCPGYLAPVVTIWPFEWGHIVDLHEAGWTYWQIAAHVGHNLSLVCRCFQQWSVEHSHTYGPGSGWLHSKDAHQDQCIVRAVLAPWTASREEICAHVAPAVSPRTTVNGLLAAGLRSCVPMARLPQHCQARLLWCCERVDWRVEWHFVVFSDENRFCLYANDWTYTCMCRPGEHHLP